jgi:hypothetical protein
MVHREQKRGRFAGAGLRLTGDVLPFESERKSLALNRSAVNESCVGYSPL